MIRISLLALIASAALPAAAGAQSFGRWHYDYQMGTGSFSTGQSDSRTQGWLSLQCVPDGKVMLYAQIAGVAPPANSSLIVTTGAKAHHYLTGKGGDVTFAGKRARMLRELWSDLGRNDIVTIRFPNGQSSVLSLDGARKTLGPTPCPA